LVGRRAAPTLVMGGRRRGQRVDNRVRTDFTFIVAQRISKKRR
jgi:hypothetical protein